MQAIHLPSLLETLFLLPMTILFVFACIPITIKVLSKNVEPSNNLTLALALLGVVASAVMTVLQGYGAQPIFSGALTFDRLSGYSNLGVLVITAFTLLLSKSNVNTKGNSFAEHVFLVLLSAMGMLTLNSSADLIVAFVGLEIMSISLYILIGLGHEQEYSKEAAFKYFILGSFASAIFLYGIALIYGTAGSTLLSQLSVQAPLLGVSNRLFLTGLILLIVGIGFKVSLFPFHAWTPDVYQGAPTSVSAFMATGVKVVMFTLFLRLAAMHVFLGDPKIILVLQVVAVLTMTVGNITAIVQDNMKRLIAYSSIAHAGYILIGIIVAAGTNDPDAISATLFYLLTYSVMNLGAFAVVSAVEKGERGQLSIGDYAGLGFKYPLLGIGLAVFMFSLAGIPPTAGFLGKFYIFAAAVKNGYLGLAIVGVINSLLSVYYYLRVLVYMYMREEVFDVEPSRGLSGRFVIVASVILILAMGIFSSLIYLPAVSQVFHVSQR